MSFCHDWLIKVDILVNIRNHLFASETTSISNSNTDNKIKIANLFTKVNISLNRNDMRRIAQETL